MNIKKQMSLVYSLAGNVHLTLVFTLSNARQFYFSVMGYGQSMGK